MLGMNLRYYIYVSIGAATLVCLVIDPELIGKSSLSSLFASLVDSTREAFASLW